jgi:hypothetical protein
MAERKATNKRGSPKKGATNSWKAPFIRAMARTGVVSYACKRAKVGRARAYEARQTDPHFAEAWDEAEVIAKEGLEAEAHRRALSYSDVLMIFLLKSKDRAKYGDRAHLELTGPNGGPMEIATPAQRAKALTELIAKATDGGDSDSG